MENVNFDSDNIEPISCTPITSVKKSITVRDSLNSEIEKMLSSAINLNECNVYHEPTCPICNSTLREEAEKIWLDLGNNDHKPIIELFIKKSKENISKPVVLNHMFNHNSGIKELQQKEYIARIQRSHSPNTSTIDQIDIAITTLMERLSAVNSMTPDGDMTANDIEKVKTETTCKIIGQLGNLVKTKDTILNELKTRGDMILIPKKDFESTFGDAYQNCRTDGERMLIHGMLERLKLVVRG